MERELESIEIRQVGIRMNLLRRCMSQDRLLRSYWWNYMAIYALILSADKPKSICFPGLDQEEAASEE